jgi:membrane associated rhomboid family serine protease
MILPFPIHFKDWKNYPFTLLLIGLNFFIYLVFFSGPTKEPSRDFLEADSLKLTGRLYSQYLAQDKKNIQRADWVNQMKADVTDHLVALGIYALRDAQFLVEAESFSFEGDQVAIKSWKENFVDFQRRYQDQPLYRFGLSSMAKKSMAWITYQFSHSGFLHIFSNLIFLFLMGMAVESLVGGVGLLALYLLGGFCGGAIFLWMDSHGSIPMVGASASISALMAFYCLAEKRLRVRYYYFISPVPGQHGEIYLPTLLIIPLFLLSDLGNLWSQPEGLGGGVAYAAHIGGSLFGLAIAILYRVFRGPLVLKNNAHSGEL